MGMNPNDENWSLITTCVDCDFVLGNKCTLFNIFIIPDKSYCNEFKLPFSEGNQEELKSITSEGSPCRVSQPCKLMGHSVSFHDGPYPVCDRCGAHGMYDSRKYYTDWYAYNIRSVIEAERLKKNERREKLYDEVANEPITRHTNGAGANPVR